MMDESDDIDVAKQQLQQAQHILQIQQREQESIRATLTDPNSDNHYNVWASKHAPSDYIPSLSSARSFSSYSKNNNNSSSQYSSTLDLWDDDKPVLDANGEPLIPPSSSAGRVEEMRRKNKGRQQY